VLKFDTSMADQSFQEIQLSGKQLFFFFMCAVVLAAVIFLLGVSVGRDFRSGPIESVQAKAEPDNPVGAVPPPTETGPNELSYAKALQGGDADAKVPPPVPPPAKAEAPKETPAKAEAPKAAASEPPKVEPPKAAPPKTEPPKVEAPKAAPKADVKSEPPKAAPPAPAPAPPKSEPPAPAASADGFSLQMGAYSTEAAATSMIADLKRKGHTSTLVTMPVNTDVRFRVYIGPYRSRAEAQRAQSKLAKEGFPSLIKR
jgi:cell division septation protein DedD